MSAPDTERTAEVGDRVRILEDPRGDYFQKGDSGVLVEYKDWKRWEIDFNNAGNSHVYGDGFWYCKREAFEIL